MPYENYRPNTREELLALRQDADDSFIASVNNAFACTQFSPQDAIDHGTAIVKTRLQLAIANAGLAGCDMNFRKPGGAIEALDKEFTYRNILGRAKNGDYSFLSIYFFDSAGEFHQLAKKSREPGAKKYFQRISDSWKKIAIALPAQPVSTS